MKGTRWFWALAALLACLPAPATAQRGSVDVLAGLTFSTLTGAGVSDYPELESRRGIHIGVYSDLPLPWVGSVVSVGPGAMFLDKGFAFGGSSSIKLSYLEAQLPLRVTLPVAAGVRLRAFAGPGFGLEFGCLIRDEADGVQSSLECRNADLQFKSFDVTALAGATLMVPAASGVWILLGGALDASQRSIDDTFARSEIKNRAWLISGGVSFLPGRTGRR